ncbi:glutaredoxin domain-containing protein [Actinomyces faecalis]|uniref:glutaredoxin domain-containing protein n=1 Tax=Actinomyces faecalis TaxID=2722820 RepID=UPI00155268F0|nr:glutaredoxin domain-containing protein [Actinomyces faecalis]
MSYTVTVFTRPGCRQCQATMRRLDRAGVSYDIQEVAHYGSLVEVIKARGLLGAPLVVVRDDGQTAVGMLGRPAARWLDTAAAFWSGFHPDLIDRWTQVITSARGAEVVS